MLSLDRRNSRQSISTVTLNLQSDTGSKHLQLPFDDGQYQPNAQNLRPKRKPVIPWKQSGSLVDQDQTYFNMALSGTKYLENTTRKCDETSLAEPTNQNKETTIQNGVVEADVPHFKHPLPPILNKDIEHHSFLPFGFGFNKNRSDTFMGIQIRKNKLKSLDDQIASQAKRHLFACSNVGSVRNVCRANQNVVALKQTLETKNSNEHQYLIKQSAIPARFSNTPLSSCRVLTRAEVTRTSRVGTNGTAMPEISGYSLMK